MFEMFPLVSPIVKQDFLTDQGFRYLNCASLLAASWR